MHFRVRTVTRDDLAIMLRLSRPEVSGNRPGAQRSAEEWECLWDGLSPHGVVVEDLDLAPADAVGILVAALVSHDCFEKCIQAERPGLLSNLSAMVRSKEVVKPSEAEIGVANAGSGSYMLVCHIGWAAPAGDSELAANIRAHMATAYAERFSGNRLCGMFGEVDTPETLQAAIGYGTRVLRDYPEWYVSQTHDSPERRSHIVGVLREEGLRSGNFWMERMFTYFPPKFLFTGPQRETLILAREGYTDVEIGQTLGVSADSIKKRWGSIYERVKEVLPNLLPSSLGAGRGTEKRRAVLHHLRDRPEELRPYSRRGSSKG